MIIFLVIFEVLEILILEVIATPPMMIFLKLKENFEKIQNQEYTFKK